MPSTDSGDIYLGVDVGTSGVRACAIDDAGGTVVAAARPMPESRRAGAAVEQDPARLRPSDNPVVLGDAARLTADTAWRPEIPIETTLADLLAWWRTRIAAAR